MRSRVVPGLGLHKKDDSYQSIALAMPHKDDSYQGIALAMPHEVFDFRLQALKAAAKAGFVWSRLRYG